jgi:hypothetical protein
MAQIYDPDSVSLSWIVDWDFGDGTQHTGGVNASHSYLDDGEFTVSATVTDTYSANGTGTVQVTVNNVAPELISLDPLHAQAGKSFNLEMFFTDPGVLDTHQVEITWSVGVSETIHLSADVLIFSTTHTYEKAGTYQVLVKVTDKDGGVDTYTVSIEVGVYRVMLPVILIGK